MWFWWPFFVLQIWRRRTLNIKRYPTDSNSAHPNYVKASGKQIIYLFCRAKFDVSDSSPVWQFHKRLLYSYIKKYINIYQSKYHWLLNKYISGFGKHRTHRDMGNNYVLFSRFHWPCWVFCFVADLFYCVFKNNVSTYVERLLFTPLQHAIISL